MDYKSAIESLAKMLVRDFPDKKKEIIDMYSEAISKLDAGSDGQDVFDDFVFDAGAKVRRTK
jgi:hypothetical protein